MSDPELVERCRRAANMQNTAFNRDKIAAILDEAESIIRERITQELDKVHNDSDD